MENCNKKIKEEIWRVLIEIMRKSVSNMKDWKDVGIIEKVMERM
jgi:hypothetical protein